jgi:hypothetical protein
MKMKLLFPLILIAFMIACSPATKIEKSWYDPSVDPASIKPFTKVLVVAGVADESSKRIAEDKLVAAMKSGVGVQAYSYLLPSDTNDRQLDAKLKKDGFDGILLMRLKNVEKSTSYVEGTGYGGWYGYRYSSPGYYSEDKTYLIETSIYSLDPNKLLWTSTTSTLNPSKFGTTMDAIIAVNKAELESKGFLPK